jgi:TonB family protein
MKSFLIIISLFFTIELLAQDTIIPQFIGGEEARLDFLVKNLRYPEDAKELGIQGKVIVKFIIEPDSTISNISIINGIGGGCDQEVIRLVKLMNGHWIPGFENGLPVRASYEFPVKFTLELSNSNNSSLTFYDTYNIGIELMKKGNYKKAVAYLTNYKSGDQVHLDALYALGLCKFYLSDYKGAIADWEELKTYEYNDCKPKLAEAYFKIGNQYLNEKKYPGAANCYTKALENAPNDVNVIYNRGIAYFYIGEKSSACNDWYHAKELGSEDVQAFIDEYCTKK